MLDSIQKVSAVVDALKAGKLKIRPQDEAWAKELLSLPRGLTGLLDISKLSPAALAQARATAMALIALTQEGEDHQKEKPHSIEDYQCELFRLYEEIFLSLTGAPSDSIASTEEIRLRMIERVRQDSPELFDDFNAAIGELEELYNRSAGAVFRAAKSLGGVKTVTGGQRQFGLSALTAARIAGLYCDTQLIPDPVWPFLASNLRLNALHLQLAIVLFHILPLRPLADARLPISPILIFPSFEEALEEKDAVTQAGIASLAVKVIAPVCDASLTTIEELFDYATKSERQFLDAITREKLFIPPGIEPQDVGTAEQAARIYLKEIEGIRDREIVDKMKTLPIGFLVLNGIFERIRPQYHIRENSEELNAQPILSQSVHWYYFERCAQVDAKELVNEKVISQEAFVSLRALQDDSLGWLANIPIAGLVELRQRMEHADLREQLKKYTAQLTSAGPAELEAVVREVRHGLEALVQRQQKAIKDIEDKYSPKKWAAGTGALFGALAGASMSFMPSLAALAGVTAPAATIITAAGAGGIAAGKEVVSQLVEKRRARRTLLGMLATARFKHK